MNKREKYCKNLFEVDLNDFGDQKNTIFEKILPLISRKISRDQKYLILKSFFLLLSTSSHRLVGKASDF